VQYLDRERVATSPQSFNCALTHLNSSPFSQVLVVRPGTGEEFRLDLRYLHTTAEGEEFEAMRANLDAIASHMGMGPAFRLRAGSTCTAWSAARESRAGRASRSARRPLIR
jgi:hypothetical protein